MLVQTISNYQNYSDLDLTMFDRNELGQINLITYNQKVEIQKPITI